MNRPKLFWTVNGQVFEDYNEALKQLNNDNRSATQDSTQHGRERESTDGW